MQWDVQSTCFGWQNIPSICQKSKSRTVKLGLKSVSVNINHSHIYFVYKDNCHLKYTSGVIFIMSVSPLMTQTFSVINLVRDGLSICIHSSQITGYIWCIDCFILFMKLRDYVIWPSHMDWLVFTMLSKLICVHLLCAAEGSLHYRCNIVK